jgi:hypothetical protein
MPTGTVYRYVPGVVYVELLTAPASPLDEAWRPATATKALSMMPTPREKERLEAVAMIMLSLAFVALGFRRRTYRYPPTG